MQSENEESHQNSKSDHKAKGRFPGSPVRVTSEDTESGGGLNLAVKRAKPNNAGPTLSVPRQLNEGSPMKKKKKLMAQEARRAKAATAVTNKQNADGNNDSPGPSDRSTPHASIPIKQAKLKENNRQTSPEAKLEAFQKHSKNDTR